MARFGERTRSGQAVTGFSRRPSAGVTYGVATGGTSSAITDGGLAYTLLTFTTDGTLTVSKAGLFDLMCVGGGGASGGGVSYGGEPTGGGGGGQVAISTLFLPAGSYTVDVGVGGAGASDGNGGDGEPSLIYNAKATTSVLFATGGQGGAGSWGGVSRYSGNQGGQSYRNGYNQTVAGAISLSPLGYNGGGSQNSTTRSGGGGGAGGDASDTTAGAGRTVTFTGSSVTFGQGGGGNGASGGTNTPTTANSGNGGNGKYTPQNYVGLNGQAGAVYVRFRP